MSASIPGPQGQHKGTAPGSSARRCATERFEPKMLGNH
jgi:hypothetical protein